MNLLPVITVSRKMHEGWICLFLYFKADEELSRIALEISALWSRTYCGWYLVENSFSIHDLFAVFQKVAVINISDLEPYESFGAYSIPAPTEYLITKAVRDIEDINEEKE